MTFLILFQLVPTVLSNIRALIEYKPLHNNAIETGESPADQSHGEPAVDDSEINIKAIFRSIFYWVLLQGLYIFLSVVIGVMGLKPLDSDVAEQPEQPVEKLTEEPVKDVDAMYDSKYTMTDFEIQTMVRIDRRNNARILAMRNGSIRQW